MLDGDELEELSGVQLGQFVNAALDDQAAAPKGQAGRWSAWAFMLLIYRYQESTYSASENSARLLLALLPRAVAGEAPPEEVSELLLLRTYFIGHCSVP
jgi:hypothetical protein